MTLNERILFHQVHPAKLGTDVAAAIVSFYFLWRQELILGLLLHFIPPPIASLIVMRHANLDGYKNSVLGAYLLRYMTPAAQAARLVGDVMMVFASWFHSVRFIVMGCLIVMAAWSYGLALKPLR
jgi:hypothetical protein